MSEKKIGIILEARLTINPNKIDGTIGIQKTEDGVPVGYPHTDIITISGSPSMAIQAVGGRVKMDLIEGLEIFLGL